MRRVVPLAVGAVLLLVGSAWALQGAGVIGGSSLMDNNSMFVFLGGFVALLGGAVMVYGLLSKPRQQVGAVA